MKIGMMVRIMIWRRRRRMIIMYLVSPVHWHIYTQQSLNQKSGIDPTDDLLIFGSTGRCTEC